MRACLCCCVVCLVKSASAAWCGAESLDVGPHDEGGFVGKQGSLAKQSGDGLFRLQGKFHPNPSEDVGSRVMRLVETI